MANYTYIRYWEDLSRERLIFAEQDAHSYRLAQELFGYKKRSSFYIYHQGTLGGYFSTRDLKEENRVGFDFYSEEKNARRVIQIKKDKRRALDAFVQSAANLVFSELPDERLRELIPEALRQYYEVLNAHVLTQPQFFEDFESKGDTGEEQIFKELAHARFEYTRKGFMSVMDVCRKLLAEYGKRMNLSLAEVESLTKEEFIQGKFVRDALKQRADKFVLTLDGDVQHVFTEEEADMYIQKYKTVKQTDFVKGVRGNRGIAVGPAFVMKNEEFDYHNLPSGMKKGMILIIQNAWPELAAYYPLAAAIVTNEGGITSHGVVVAREFNIPCIVRTYTATEIFKTGDTVEVDANRGVVRKL